MKREYILTAEEKAQKRQKIEQNRFVTAEWPVLPVAWFFRPVGRFFRLIGRRCVARSKMWGGHTWRVQSTNL